MGINPEDGGFSSFTKEEMGLGLDSSKAWQYDFSSGPDADCSGESWEPPAGRLDMILGDLLDFSERLQKLQQLAGELLPAVNELHSEVTEAYQMFEEEREAAKDEDEWEQADDRACAEVDEARLELHRWIEQIAKLTKEMKDLEPLGQRWNQMAGELRAEPDVPKTHEGLEESGLPGGFDW